MMFRFTPAALFLPALLSAVPASAEVQMTGAFVAREACAATPSIHRTDNPGDVHLLPGQSYELRGKNKDEATHFEIIVPEADPKLRWAPVSCGDVAAAATGKTSQAPQYVFAFSWEPGYCKQTGDDERKPECLSEAADRFDAKSLSLHGLWPQPKSNVYCVPSDLKRIVSNEKMPFDQLPDVPISSGVFAKLQAVMPGTQSSLQRHEWFKHGTCMPHPDVDGYFSTETALAGELNSSKLGDLFASRVGSVIQLSEIKSALDESFGPGAGDRVEVHCVGREPDRYVTEVWLFIAGDMDAHPDLKTLIAAGPKMPDSCPSGRVLPSAH